MARYSGFEVGILAVLMACGGSGNSSKNKRPEMGSETGQRIDSLALRQLGDSVTAARQQLLLERLLTVAEREGWGGAVRYCHTAAETLAFYYAGSLSLQRIAERHRNPKNRLQDSVDQKVFNHYAQAGEKAPLLIRTGGEWRYYRPIYLMMPTCLKCHGDMTELDALALTEIRRRYPGDKATGFQMGELRGLWRMTCTPAL